MKAFLQKVAPYFDIPLVPFVVLAGLIMRAYRVVGSSTFRISTATLKRMGVFPIVDHYYEPMFNDAHLSKELSAIRDLPGIEFRADEQLKLLDKLTYQTEFEGFLSEQKRKMPSHAFSFGNGNFESGDAEFLFNFVRHTKPSRVIEIGCGASTKIIAHALKLNDADSGNRAHHLCIEPYEQPWLEGFESVEVIRSKVETLELSIFKSLNSGDLLFIDSSHIIRPQGDVLREYLQIIPSLNGGVYVHVHDIFSPRDYLSKWVREDVRFWNEQYVLEAMLSNNPSYQVIAALNFLMHSHYEELLRVCPYIDPSRQPGSFYFRALRAEECADVRT